MIVRRLVAATLALAVMAAASGVVVVSAAFAIYTLLRDGLGPSGAAAVIAAGFAVVLAVAGLILARGVLGRKPKPAPEADKSLAARVVDVLRQRPIVAAGAALAAGLIAWRNPALVAVALRAFDTGSGRTRNRP